MRLLKIELKKILSYSNFWVFIGLYLGLFITTSLIASNIETNINGNEISLNTFFQFPKVWSMLPWMASWFNILLTILVILLVGNEFTYKTFRQHIISGLTVKEVILSKFILIALISIFSSVVIFLLSIVYGVSLSEESFDIFSNSYIILVYFLQTLAYMSMGLLITILVKNVALSILSFLLYFFPIELIIRNMFPETISKFFPINIISHLTPSPDFLSYAVTNISKQQGSDPSQIISTIPLGDNLSLATTSIIGFVYVIIFLGASYLIIKNRDL